MSQIFKNTSRVFRREMQSQGIGLNASGSYLFATLDGAELDHLKTVNFLSLSWSSQQFALVLSGNARRGCLVRFVNLTPDWRYCRFPAPFTYLSPKILNATPQALPAFLRSIAANSTLKIYRPNERREYVGILVGPRNGTYKSIVTIVDDRIRAVDIEEKPPSHGPLPTAIREENPPEGESVRARLLELFG
ncbi:MAG: hypothetical protein JWL59_4814 [Chthoniobacteraceae bacterium]|nr:hypothetical protein [Chthoniobacteraceae bacterium]